MTRIPAVVAASTLKRGFDAARDDDDPAAPSERGTWHVRLPRPSFLAGVDEDEPTRRGTRTHRFLQFVDLTGDCGPAGLRAQAAQLAARGVLSTAEAEGLDFDAIGWFFDSPLGRRLRTAGVTARREVPFVLSVPSAWHRLIADSESPSTATGGMAEDRVLVRGMIDCFFEDDGGVTLLDYKTDAIRPNEVAARSAIYAPQLAVYAGAVEAIWRIRVAERALVFLGARRIANTPA